MFNIAHKIPYLAQILITIWIQKFENAILRLNVNNTEVNTKNDHMTFVVREVCVCLLGSINME